MFIGHKHKKGSIQLNVGVSLTATSGSNGCIDTSLTITKTGGLYEIIEKGIIGYRNSGISPDASAYDDIYVSPANIFNDGDIEEVQNNDFSLLGYESISQTGNAEVYLYGYIKLDDGSFLYSDEVTVTLTTNVLQNNLESHWSMDGTLADSLGNHTMSIVGGPEVYESGKTGDAIRLNGVNKYLRADSVTDSDVYSVSMRYDIQNIKPGFGNISRQIREMISSPDDRTFEVQSDDSGQSVYRFLTITVNESNDTHKLYMNGNEIADGTNGVYPGHGAGSGLKDFILGVDAIYLANPTEPYYERNDGKYEDITLHIGREISLCEHRLLFRKGQGLPYKKKARPFIMTVNYQDTSVPQEIGYVAGTLEYVDWGDGTINTETEHTYASTGEYDIKIIGEGLHLRVGSIATDIKQRGDVVWGSMEQMFVRSPIETRTATDTPDLSSVTDMSYMFYGAKSFNQPLNNWDTSSVTDMRYMFFGATSFNQPLNDWDTSNVTDMKDMFFLATSFNQPLNDWDTSNITDMSYMFYIAKSFNQNLNNWDTSNVTDMNHMFYNATSFNQNLNNWDTSNVTNMSHMFEEATTFNQPLNNWDTSNVTDMSHMFYIATSFNQPLNNWDTSNVTNMSHMFREATSFNQNLNNWDTSNVTDMEDMFYIATSFNQPLNDWDTSNVTDMRAMFKEATSFNQPLNNWDTSNVTYMSYMFEEATTFNQPLNNWDTSSVTDMNYMFYSAKSFNQPLNNWDTSNVTDMNHMFRAANTFDQDISNRCVTNIPSKPAEFDDRAGFEGQTAKQPQWGTCP